ncbi:MAG: CPBP family intramembrane metalloprotease, partial [Clostridia bacterium]|nr:CPBP family intramembrane metalloprotease [Clostridia bacterium]
PIVGMIAFCVITVALGIMCDWLYEKSQCIWLPSIFHGAFNAAATIPLCITIANTGSMRLLGSAPNGLLAGLPIIAFAVILFVRYSKEQT